MARFFKGYKFILWLALAVVVIPLIIASYYNRPVLDDVLFLCETEKIDPSAGFVPGVLKMAVNFMVTNYYSITGTFSTYFFYPIIWSIFKSTLPNIYPSIILFLIVFTCFRLARCFRVVRPEISRDGIDCLALLMGIVILLFIPSALDSIFWVAGSVYPLALMVSLCAFCSLFRRCYQGVKPSWRDSFFWVYICLCFFSLGGGDHLNATASIVLYFFFALWVLCAKKRKVYLLPFAFLVAGYILAVIAPGNFIRQASIGGRQSSLMWAALMSLVQTFSRAFFDGRIYVALLLFLPMAVEIGQRFAVSGKHVALVALASLALMVSSVFPNFYASYQFASRHMVKFYITLCLLLVLNLIVLMGYIARREKGEVSDGPAHLPAKHYIATICATVVALGIMSVPDIQHSPLRLNCTIPSVKAISYLRDGSLTAYTEEYAELTALLKNSSGEVVIPANPHNSLLGGPELSWDVTQWQNIYFAQYYGGEGVSVRVGDS